MRTAIESGSPAQVLDAAVPPLARELAATIPQDSRDAAPTQRRRGPEYAGRRHWVRYRFLADGEDQVVGGLAIGGPFLVPEPVRTHLADFALEVAIRGTEPYGNYQRTEDIGLLLDIINHFRMTVEDAPADHPARPRMLSRSVWTQPGCNSSSVCGSPSWRAA